MLGIYKIDMDHVLENAQLGHNQKLHWIVYNIMILVKIYIEQNVVFIKIVRVLDRQILQTTDISFRFHETPKNQNALRFRHNYFCLFTLKEVS